MSKIALTRDSELERLMNHVRGWRTYWIGLADSEITPDEQEFWQPFVSIWTNKTQKSNESCAIWLYQEIGSWGAIDQPSGERWNSSMPVSYLAWTLKYPNNEPLLLPKPISISHWQQQIFAFEYNLARARAASFEIITTAFTSK